MASSNSARPSATHHPEAPPANARSTAAANPPQSRATPTPPAPTAAAATADTVDRLLSPLPYTSRDAANAARRGACLVAWPADEPYRAPPPTTESGLRVG